MTGLTPALDAALSADKPIIFGAVEINLPGYDIRLLDGSGIVAFGGHAYTGLDPTYGVLAAIDSLSDGVGDEAPGLNITLQPATDAAVADLASPEMQGSRVRLWLGAIDRPTGAAITSPFLLFDGQLDVPTLKVGLRTRDLEYECVSSFEQFFFNEEGTRLSDSFHESIWPGELGFTNMTGITRTIYWGVAAPAGTISYAGSGVAYGGTGYLPDAS